MDTEPSTRLPEEDRAGIRPDLPGLRTQEGVGTNTAGRSRGGGFSDSTAGASRRRGDGASTSTAGSSVASNLAAGEQGATQGGGGADAGFAFSPGSSSSSTILGRLRAFVSGNPRKLIIGGGATGVILTGLFVGLTFVIGPGQLIQLSEMF
ncbi:MAG: hypothetical protein WA843_00315, partial [Candidatus Saccharimonadales bacterium]